MIAKMVKGRGFRGAAEYNLKEEKGYIIATNMAGQTPRALAAEFGEIRKLRPNLGKAVLHVSLSAALGEKLTDPQWTAIGHRYLRDMGFTDNQFVMTRHTDTEHEHIHILANRITHGGDVVSDSQDYRRQETIMREIERDFGLQQVTPSVEAKRRAPTKGEIEGAIRTGQPSTRQQLQQMADAAAKDCPDFTTYQTRLEKYGVELIPVVQLQGTKLSGLSYRLDGVTMKGSDLGKTYTAAGIQKRGISYEQDRDHAAVSRSSEREARRAFGEPDGSRQAGGIEQRGGIGLDAGTLGAGNRSSDGRDAADIGRGRAPEQGAGRTVPEATTGIGAGIQGSSQGSAASSIQPEPGRAADGVAALPAGWNGRDGYGGAGDRILALAGTAERNKSPRPGSGSGVSQTRPDRSSEAIRKQINAFGVEHVEVGIRHSSTGQMMNRAWTRAELYEAIAWLKRMNARGNDVYIRPAKEHGLVLIDDLTAGKIAAMQKDGFAPTARIETSPGNYQVWIKLSEEPVSAEERWAAAQMLAKHYGGDMNSASSSHYGRLAGFTNQKPKHARNGSQPYVLAHECPGNAPERAGRLLEHIRHELGRVRAEKARSARFEALESYKPAGRGWSTDPGHEYLRQAQRLIQRYGKSADISRMDWMIATDMAKSGQFSAEGIAQAIAQHSPNVDTRKAGHIEDYAKRTALAAWNAPEVQAQRQKDEQQARQAQRDRGNSARER